MNDSNLPSRAELRERMVIPIISPEQAAFKPPEPKKKKQRTKLNDRDWEMLRCIENGAMTYPEIANAMGLLDTSTRKPIIDDSINTLRRLSMIEYLDLSVPGWDITDSGRYYLREHDNG
jgi:hypothetical protein